MGWSALVTQCVKASHWVTSAAHPTPFQRSVCVTALLIDSATVNKFQQNVTLINRPCIYYFGLPCSRQRIFFCRFTNLTVHYLGPFYGVIAVPSVTRCRSCRCCCRCGHRFYIAIHQVSLLSHAACAIAIAHLGSGVNSSDTWWMAM